MQHSTTNRSSFTVSINPPNNGCLILGFHRRVNRCHEPLRMEKELRWAEAEAHITLYGGLWHKIYMVKMVFSKINMSHKKLVLYIHICGVGYVLLPIMISKATMQPSLDWPFTLNMMQPLVAPRCTMPPHAWLNTQVKSNEWHRFLSCQIPKKTHCV